MPTAPLPASLRARSDREAIVADIEPYLGTTVDERVEIMAAPCRAAAESIAAHPAGDRILAWQEPRSAQSEALSLDLVRRARPTG
ncbi:MAG: hypothetical protein FJ148_22390 [Deltaproteobacteria bacterium]|nr:hypothetical protein [Deltaproteobacteria bacterium]